MPISHRIKEIATLAARNVEKPELVEQDAFINELTHLIVQDVIWEVVKNEQVPMETQLLLATRLQERFSPQK